MELGDFVKASIEESVRYARTGEKIIAAKRALGAALDALRPIVVDDPEVGPEIMATVDGIVAADEALQRAAGFASVRFDERMSRLHAALGEES